MPVKACHLSRMLILVNHGVFANIEIFKRSNIIFPSFPSCDFISLFSYHDARMLVVRLQKIYEYGALIRKGS